ncbi:MAG: hypothetical protein KatS3mg105_4968 [Gemmatales bacterium]|nr:MAG: hypothetical protein KatS3mg105_4968 [Gemmatales bacterium]
MVVGNSKTANRGLLRRVQQRLGKEYHEHIAIYSSEKPPKQVWQWAVRLPDGRRLRHREHPFFSASPPIPFLTRLRGLQFTLEEEENATLLDALKRVRMALDTAADLNLFAKRPWYAKRSDELARAMKQGVPGAFEQFVEFHLPLARKASRMLIRWFGMEPDDAEQTAVIGLVQAARRFDPELGYQFSTYASYWIRQSCQRYGPEFAFRIRIPSHAFWPCYKLQFELQRLIASHGPAKAQRLFNRRLRAESISPEHWKAFQASLETETFSDTSKDEFRELRNITDKTSGPIAELQRAELKSIVRDALQHLRPRDAEVIMLRYGIENAEHTLEEVGQILGVTRERVRQIQARAEDRLQHLLRKEAPVTRQ